jgi:RHS repeat-associated protein
LKRCSRAALSARRPGCIAKHGPQSRVLSLRWLATYDHNGNLTSYKNWTYTYDAQNRLRMVHRIVDNSEILVATYYYDAKNRQIARSLNDEVRFSVWDGWELIEEYGSNRATAYLQGATGVIKSWTHNSVIYYYQDKLGSTTHIANASGQLLESFHYDLYGKPTETSAYGVIDLYAGERWVSALGLYDLRNRFMSPDLGRFLQADPIGFKGDASNLYRYCGNDSVNRTDPDGLISVDATWSRLMYWQGSALASYNDIAEAYRSWQSTGKQAGMDSWIIMGGLSKGSTPKPSTNAHDVSLKHLREMIKDTEDSTTKIVQRGKGPIHGVTFGGHKMTTQKMVHEYVRIRKGDKLYNLVHVHTRSGEDQHSLTDYDQRALKTLQTRMYFTTRDWVTMRSIEIDGTFHRGNYVVVQPDGSMRPYFDPLLTLR